MNYQAATPEGTDPKEQLNEQREALKALGYKMEVTANMSEKEGRRILEDALKQVVRERKFHETVDDENLRELWVRDRSPEELKANGYKMTAAASLDDDRAWKKFESALEKAKTGKGNYSTRHTDKEAELWMQAA